MRGFGFIFHGWKLVAIAASAVAIMAGAIVLAGEASADIIRMAIRATARTSLVLFGLAFSASSLQRLFPNAFTRWQIKNRRYLGLSFASSHMVHAAMIAFWAGMYPAAFRDYINIVTATGGGLGYVFIIALAVTSFDGAVRWMGARRWRLLHIIGSYYIWFVFAQSEIGRAFGDPLNTLWAVLVLAVLAIRIAAWFAARRSKLAAV